MVKRPFEVRVEGREAASLAAVAAAWVRVGGGEAARERASIPFEGAGGGC